MSSKAVLLAVLIVCVCGAVIVVHLPALSAQALSFDDDMYFVNNNLVKNPGWFSTWSFLSQVLEPSTVKGYYQPLTMISLMVDYSLGGRVGNLMSFHRTSLALHAANTALIIVLLYLLFGQVWIAAAVGLLFGLHPMTVETIPWIGERKTLLAAFFAFWSLLFYIRYAKARVSIAASIVLQSDDGGIENSAPVGRCVWPCYFACLAFYFLALMSKPTSTPLPLMMLLLDFWPLKRIRWQTVFEKIPFFILTGIFSVITYISQTRTASSVLPTETGIGRVLLILCHNIVFYLYKIVWPVNLSSHYPFPDPMNLSQPMVLAGVIGTCILIPLLLISLRWTRAALTCWMCFFIVILPTMQIIGFSTVIASDKFAYLPSFGLLMLLVFFLSGIKSLFRKPLYKIILAIFILSVASGESFATRSYLVHWQNSIGLYEYMISKAPNAVQLNNNLGNAYNEAGRFQEAIKFYDKAIAFQPDDVQAYNNAGNVYGKVGDVQKEMEYYQKAIKVDPGDAQAYFNLGCAYGKIDDHQQELEYYKKAIEVKPDLAEAYFNIGTILRKLGDSQQAIECYKSAIKYKYYFADAYFNLANALDNVGQYDQAIENYRQTIRIKPDFVSAYIGLGISYGNIGDKHKEIEYYKQAIKLEPGNFAANFNLGICYGKLGLYEQAIECYKSAIKSKPDFAPAYKNLGKMFGNLGRYDQAIDCYNNAIRINPDFADAHYYLGVAFAKLGKLDEAVKEFKEALRINPDYTEAVADLAEIEKTKL